MPEDKDFKRLVRARMAETGKPYTRARAELRPPDGTEQPPVRAETAFPVSILPMDVETLVTPYRPPIGDASEPPTTFGPGWVLELEAGGPLTVLSQATVPVTALRDLGTALSGVPFVSFGVDLLIPAPVGSDPESRDAPPPEARHAAFNAVNRAQVALRELLRDRFALDVSALAHESCRASVVTGRPRRSGDEVVVPGRGRMALFVHGEGGDALGEVGFDPFAWSSSVEALPGALWVGFGVVLGIEATFATRELPPRPADVAHPVRPQPLVGEDFWSEVGAAFLDTASALSLPPWPLLQGSLRLADLGMNVIHHWQASAGWPP